MLYLISTPIGHLADFSFRAVEVLGSVDYILCEDTRHSRVLLDRYQIKTPCKPFHKFNASRSHEAVFCDLRSGKNIALISDAGTPLIADPGSTLVEGCHQEGLPVTTIPGPCALISGLLLSGFLSCPFQFLGFLPKKEQEMKTVLSYALCYEGTSIAYETPHRIEATLQMLHLLAPFRSLCIARELTKCHEECLRGTAEELLNKFAVAPPRGEMVLLISPCVVSLDPYEGLSLKEMVNELIHQFDLSQSEAIKLAAKLRQIPKRELYAAFHNLNNDPPC